MEIVKIKTKETLACASATNDLSKSNKSTMPILDCAKIEIYGQDMKITGSNLDNYIESSTKVESITNNCAFCVNSNDFTKVLASIRDEYVNLYVDEKNIIIKHTCGEILLPTYDIAEYPTLKLNDESVSFKVGSDTLKYILQYSRPFMSNDILRPTMCGVYVHVHNGNIEFCATDAHALITDSIFINAKDVDTDFIVSSQVVGTILSVCSTCEEISIDVHDTVIVFNGNNCTAYATKIEGKFPNYKAIVPDKDADGYDKVYTLKKSVLSDALKRCLVSCGTTLLVKMDFGDRNLHITTENIDFGKKAEETFVCEGGNPITLGASYTVLMNALSVFDEDNVTIKMNAPNRAILFYDTTNVNRTVLIMPMMIQ